MAGRKHPKSKTTLLKDFTKVLHKHDPMKLRSPLKDEYEAEALSILARFCEGAIHAGDDEQSILEYATSTVKQTFHHWFEETLIDEVLQPLVLELLVTYIKSFPVKGKEK